MSPVVAGLRAGLAFGAVGLMTTVAWIVLSPLRRPRWFDGALRVEPASPADPVGNQTT